MEFRAFKSFQTSTADLQPAAAGPMNAEEQAVSKIRSLGAPGKQGPAELKEMLHFVPHMQIAID